MADSIPILIPLVAMSLNMMENFKFPANEKVLLFDIDNCVYCTTSGLETEIVTNINNYISKLGNYAKDHNMARKFYKDYGLSLKGMLFEYPRIDTLDYFNHVEGALNLKKYISRDEELIELLESLKDYKLYCFTNAPAQHALNVLKIMQITKYFEGIFHVNYDKTYPIICKPSVFVYELIHKMLERCPIHFFDDSKANVTMGERYGWSCDFITKDYTLKQALRDFMKNASSDIDKNEGTEAKSSMCNTGTPAVASNVSTAILVK